jgi:hypothetical protein
MLYPPYLTATNLHLSFLLVTVAVLHQSGSGNSELFGSDSNFLPMHSGKRNDAAPALSKLLLVEKSPFNMYLKDKRLNIKNVSVMRYVKILFIKSQKENKNGNIKN